MAPPYSFCQDNWESLVKQCPGPDATFESGSTRQLWCSFNTVTCHVEEASCPVKRCDFPAPKPGTGPSQTWSCRISSQGFGLKTAISPSCKWRDQDITVTLLSNLKQSLDLFFYNKLELKYFKKNISSLMTCAIGSKGIGFSKPLWRVENMFVLSLLGKSRLHIP